MGQDERRLPVRRRHRRPAPVEPDRPQGRRRRLPADLRRRPHHQSFPRAGLPAQRTGAASQRRLRRHSPGAAGDHGPGLVAPGAVLPAGRSAEQPLRHGLLLLERLRPGALPHHRPLRADDVLLRDERGGHLERGRAGVVRPVRRHPHRPQRAVGLPQRGSPGDQPDAVDPAADAADLGGRDRHLHRAVRPAVRVRLHRLGPGRAERGRPQHRRAELPVGTGARGGRAAVDPGERPRARGSAEADRITDAADGGPLTGAGRTARAPATTRRPPRTRRRGRQSGSAASHRSSSRRRRRG